VEHDEAPTGTILVCSRHRSAQEPATAEVVDFVAEPANMEAEKLLMGLAVVVAAVLEVGA